jgi:hypothetical protein
MKKVDMASQNSIDSGTRSLERILLHGSIGRPTCASYCGTDRWHVHPLYSVLNVKCGVERKPVVLYDVAHCIVIHDMTNKATDESARPSPF